MIIVTELYYIVLNPCNNAPCKNGGTCERASATEYDCYCKPDYDDGEDCSTCEYIYVASTM